MSSAAMPSANRPASDASRPPSRAAVLAPASGSSVNKSSRNAPPVAATSASSSRKREMAPEKPLAMEDLLKPAIVIKPHPSTLMLKPTILQPLMLLPREHLSLASLDLSAPNGEFSTGAGRFFESHIRILDLEGRLGSNLLLARSDSSRATYAIERQENGLYVLCKLGGWADLQKLSESATASCQQRIRPPVLPAPAAVAEPPLTTPQLHNENKRKRLAIEELQSLVRKRPRSQSTVTQERQASQPPSQGVAEDTQQLPTPPDTDTQNPQMDETKASSAPPGSQSGLATSEANPDPVAQPTAGDIFQNIRNQYFEALYRSKGSLAYFAKGPLSRARAAFHLDCDANLEMKDLIGFLKSLVMTTVLIDKKYRETIPELITRMKTMVESSDDEGAKAKKRRPRKMKLGKDGLYPVEKEHIKKWWSVHKPEEREDATSTAPQETRYHISCLRTRETQLQMIVILEILALQALAPVEAASESQLPGTAPQDVPKESTEGLTRKRNKHNYPVLVDVHADRLCIWQSTALDDVKVMAESQGLKHGVESQQTSRPNSDPLKDFCVDIIVPFFSARLPDLCDGLNRKLGGPVIMSPPKPKQPKQPRHHAPSTTSKPPAPKPGAAVKRPVSLKGRRSLERVLSNERLRRPSGPRPNDVLARMRSATPAAIPGFKREASEPMSLASLPRPDTAPPQNKLRTMLSRSNSVCSTEDMRAKKKALVEAELHEAISALKKPNRQLAGRAIVEEAERRTLSTSSSGRKPKRPTRTPNAVQVKATPANFRFRDALAGDSQATSSLHLLQPRTDANFIPSSSVIPSSAPRVSAMVDDFAAVHVASTPLANKVQATPSHTSAVPNRLPKPNLDDFVIPPSSPILPRKAATAYQPATIPESARKPSGTLAVPSPARHQSLFETPMKRRPGAVEDVINSSPPVPIHLITRTTTAATLTATPEKKLSIYQRLGWDDDDLDEIA